MSVMHGRKQSYVYVVRDMATVAAVAKLTGTGVIHMVDCTDEEYAAAVGAHLTKFPATREMVGQEGWEAFEMALIDRTAPGLTRVVVNAGPKTTAEEMRTVSTAWQSSQPPFPIPQS